MIIIQDEFLVLEANISERTHSIKIRKTR